MPSVSPTNDALYLSASSISPAIENQGSVLAEHTSPSCMLDERMPLQGGQPHPSPFLTPGHDRVLQDFTSPASDTAPHWMQHVEEGRTAGPGEFPAAFDEQGAMTTTGSYEMHQSSIFPDTDATLGASFDSFHTSKVTTTSADGARTQALSPSLRMLLPIRVVQYTRHRSGMMIPILRTQAHQLNHTATMPMTATQVMAATFPPQSSPSTILKSSTTCSFI